MQPRLLTVGRGGPLLWLLVGILVLHVLRIPDDPPASLCLFLLWFLLGAERAARLERGARRDRGSPMSGGGR